MKREKSALQKKAEEFAVDRYDYTIDMRNGGDFIEVTGSIGGDILTYRVYKDGRVYER